MKYVKNEDEFAVSSVLYAEYTKLMDSTYPPMPKENILPW